MHNRINLCTIQCLQPFTNTNNYSCYKCTVLCLMLFRLEGMREEENLGKIKIKA